MDPVPDVPTGGDDDIDVTEDTPTTLDVLKNDTVDSDTNPELTTLTIVSVTSPSHGTAEISADRKTVLYTPEANNTADDSFTYIVQDQAGLSNAENPFTVTIHMNPVNDAPVINSTITDQQTSEHTAIGPFDFYVSDVDDAADSLNVTADSSNHTVVPQANISIDNPKDGTGLRHITVTPDGYWHGTAVITLTVQDDEGATGTQKQFQVDVASVNDPPRAYADSYQTNEDTDCTLDVLSNDKDPDIGTTDGEVLTIKSIDSPVVNADVTISGDRTKFLFHPHANWNGTVTFGYTMQDAAGITSSSNVSVLVRAVNDNPTVTDKTLSTPEDMPVEIDALAGGSDIDADAALNTDPAYNPATESILIDPNGIKGVTDGTAQINGNKIKFTPTPDWNGTTSFTYKVLDAHGGSATATVHLTITQVNDVPVAVDDAKTTDEDTPVTINVLDNDTDIDTNSSLNANPSAEHLSLKDGGLGAPGHGTVSIVSGQIQYTPNPDWNGIGSFTYTVEDASHATATGTVTVIVNPINDAPVAVDDAKETNEDLPIQIDAVGNDTDADAGDTLSLVSVSAVDYGSAQADNGKIDYNPPANWNGTARFTYTVRDAAGLTDTGEVTVLVHGVNDAPVAVADDNITTAEDTPVTINALANDWDIDTNIILNKDPDANPADEHLSLVANGFGGLDNGTAKVADGRIVFTPNPNWNGVEIFTYTVEDTHHATATGTVTVTVASSNNAPVAHTDAAETNEDASVLMNVLANDTDVDLGMEGDNLTIVSAADAAHGTVVIAGDKKSLTYTPNPDWNGTDAFTYTIQDKDSQRSTAQVTVKVDPANDPPQAIDDSVTIEEDNTAAINALANDKDVDLDKNLNDKVEDALTIVSTGAVQHGTAAISSDKKSIRFTPDLNWSGETTFGYTMQDSSNVQSSANITVTVTAVNDAPTAPKLLTPTSSDYYKDGQTVRVTWTASTDAEMDPVTYTLYFFNGSTWTRLASGLTATSYSHPLANTGLATNQVRYKVTATDGKLTTSDTGDKFIIDNAAPSGVQVNAQPGSSGWVNQNVQLSLTRGSDLLPFTYAYSMDNTNWNRLTQGQTITVSDNGAHTVYFRAVDALGNTWTGSHECKMDKLAPAQPQVALAPNGPTNKDVAITLGLAQDPGGSGNSQVRLPDGSTASGENVSYTASKNGQYTFVIYDNAGNSLTVPVGVSNIDKAAPKINIDNHAYTLGELVNKDIHVSLAVTDEGLGIASVTYAVTPTKDEAGDGQGYTGAIELGKDGTYYIHAIALDKAGNRTEEVLGPYKLDTTPPQVACKIENLTSSSGDIVLHLSDDTGVVRVHMPDGAVKEYPSKDFEFKATKSGVYTIEVVDAAGNVSTQTVTVTLPETQVPQAAMGRSAARATPGVNANTWLLGGLTVLGALLILLILLLAIWRKQVRIEYYGKDEDKKPLRVEKRFAKAPKRDGLLELDVLNKRLAPQTGLITVTFTRGFTKKMRAKEVLVLWGDMQLLRTQIDRNQSEKWTAAMSLENKE